MKIAIVGAGFTGLTAALRLLQKGYKVTIFEKESSVGGLAVGFKEKNWQWSAEKAYHHWFTNDISAFALAKELGVSVLIRRPSTDVYIKGQKIPFDSPWALLAFPYLPIIDRLRTGAAAFFLKSVNDYHRFEGMKATPWIKKWMGEKSFATIWDPLFTGKFGQYKNSIALTWFWARIKKRTPSLAYPEGGFDVFAEKIADEIKRLGGRIYLKTEVTKIKNNSQSIIVMATNKQSQYDKVIVTSPPPIFVNIIDGLPKRYVRRILSIKYLHAFNLALILDKPFMKRTYWLNITDKSFPFLVSVEHTNFMDPRHYGGQHIVYVGSYLAREHRYFKMTKEELLKEFMPYLQKINPNSQLSRQRRGSPKAAILNSQLFIGPFAQPVVTVDYEKKIPSMETPIKNVYLANIQQVYPWDRGTNYAVELGEKVARLVIST